MNDDRTLGVIHLSRVSRRYADGNIEALRGCSFVAHAGEFVAVTGPSGAGKTTLLNILGLLDRPDFGSYILEGIATGELTERHRAAVRAERVGFLFQDSMLLPNRSAIENVKLALRYSGYERMTRHQMAVDALRAVGVLHRSDADPATLSAGERQRVALARAMVTRPAVLLCDEPTGNLDTGNGQAVVRLITEAARSGSCVVVVTHDPSVAAAASREIAILDGEIVDEKGGNQPITETPTSEDARELPRLRDRIADYLEDIGTNAVHRLSRTILTGLGALLGVAIFVFSVSLSTTTANEISRQFDLVAATGIEIVSSQASGIPGVENGSALAELRSIPGVVSGGLIVELGDFQIGAAPALGLLTTGRRPVIATSDGVQDVLRYELTGRGFAEGEEATGAAVALVGRGVADAFPVSLGQGSRIQISGEQFTVVGVIDEVERHPEVLLRILIPLATAERLWSLDGSDERVVIEAEVGATEAVARQAILVLDPLSPEDLVALYAPEAEQLRAQVETQVDLLVTALAIVLLIVGIFAIGSAFLASVLERRREIGLRRALGANGPGILRLFIGESIVTGIVASLVGLVIALGSFLVLAVSQEWQPVIPLEVVVTAPIVGAIVGLLGGVIPAMRAARMEPVSALRL